MPTYQKSQGFTLLDLMIAVVICGLLASVFVSNAAPSRKEKSYLDQHACVPNTLVVHYQTPEPSWRCDNGTWNQDQLKRLSRGEELGQ